MLDFFCFFNDVRDVHDVGHDGDLDESCREQYVQPVQVCFHDAYGTVFENHRKSLN